MMRLSARVTMSMSMATQIAIQRTPKTQTRTIDPTQMEALERARKARADTKSTEVLATLVAIQVHMPLRDRKRAENYQERQAQCCKQNTWQHSQ